MNGRDCIAAYDLGTGGLKASLFCPEGALIADVFVPYGTFYPASGFREQRPGDWWEAVCRATARLLEENPGCSVIAAAISGQSIAPVLLDREGELILEQIPIWSDTRAVEEAADFFGRQDYTEWYMATGNGDPPETYTVMKLMWLKKNNPAAWARLGKVVGSKDYINFRLTGEIATDFSYASGSGVFDLKELRYRDDFLRAAGISWDILPELADSHHIVGRVHSEAAAATGLPQGIPVACGGVDNACMALGAVGIGEGRSYTSLGSSAWIAVTSRQPILDTVSRPFIFAHAERGYYTSGVSIFSAGNAYRWAAEQLCGDIPEATRYADMDKAAASVPPGAGGLLFCPALAGGSSQEPGAELSGSFVGLGMGTTRAELLRSVLEGVALSLNCHCLEALKKHCDLDSDMLLCGGGAKSPLWNQIFADIFGMDIVLRGGEQSTASLGASAIAARAVGLWSDYSLLDKLYTETERYCPDPGRRERYSRLGEIYTEWTQSILATCGKLQGLEREGRAQ